jgi:subfamily B ATP-binding cassette protein MsbA
MAAVDRIFELLDTEPDIVDKPGAQVVQGNAGRLVFDSISFSYGEGPEVLKDISVHVERGEILALVGVSGSGKSTFLDLIPRFYDPTHGSIRLDGQDLRDLKVDSLRSRMGIVTQDIILFNDSVFRNIAYGAQDASAKQVEQAARMANAHDFIGDLSEGYETVIGNRGVRLSGGQRQRLAIARALLKDPEILVFDEATSALDSEAELLVQEAIDRLMKNRTVFVVAHRLSTIRHANRILVLDRGRIIESGTHDALLKGNGQYRYLHDLQFRSAPDRRTESAL